MAATLFANREVVLRWVEPSQSSMPALAASTTGVKPSDICFWRDSNVGFPMFLNDPEAEFCAFPPAAVVYLKVVTPIFSAKRYFVLQELFVYFFVCPFAPCIEHFHFVALFLYFSESFLVFPQGAEAAEIASVPDAEGISVGFCPRAVFYVFGVDSRADEIESAEFGKKVGVGVGELDGRTGRFFQPEKSRPAFGVFKKQEIAAYCRGSIRKRSAFQRESVGVVCGVEEFHGQQLPVFPRKVEGVECEGRFFLLRRKVFLCFSCRRRF